MVVFYLILAVLVFAVGANVVRLLQRQQRAQPQPTPDTDSADYFREQCQSMLETGKLDELIAFACDRITERPNHTYARWYLARALYLQQKWPEALAAFNEVARLDPSWIEDNVAPYVRAIEARTKPREMPITPEMPEQRTLH